MTSTRLFSSTSFVYLNSDVPEGQTLTEWRQARDAARRAARGPRRGLRVPRLHLAG
jgi:hypothetical protein